MRYWNVMADILDLRGLKCPLPALLARRALARLAPGARLTVTADDPLAAVDIPHMCHHEGHAVERTARRDGYVEFVLRTARWDPSAAGERPTAPDD
jgi:tRNA 2-thiouridine synthesizing protein A